MIAEITILKANIRFSVVKGMKFDMTELLPSFLVGLLGMPGLILLFLFFTFANISDATMHAVVMYARIAKGTHTMRKELYREQ